MTVPQTTIAGVLAWVSDDPQRAREALDAERRGAQRSTLISQLEPIASREASNMSERSYTDTDTDTNDDLADERAEQSDEQAEQQQELAPEQPRVHEIYAQDAGVTIIGPLRHDADVEIDDDARLTADQDREQRERREREDRQQVPIEGEPVDYMEAAAGPHGLILGLNGTAYSFDPQDVGQLKQIVDKTVVGLGL